MRTYSTDMRRSIVRAYEGGQGSLRQLARVFGVSVSFVQKLVRQYRQTGNIDVKQHGGGHPGKITRRLAEVERIRRQWPQASLQELCERFTAATHVAVSRATMSRALRRLTMVEKTTTDSQEREAAEGRSSTVSSAKGGEVSEE